jgi:Ca2+-binding RTX toxin-like protein
VQFNELDWGSDSAAIDWGEVQWNEVSKTGYSQINWSYVQFSELDAPDLTAVRRATAANPAWAIGSLSADTLNGSQANNVLLGLSGNDVLKGNAGDDTLTGCLAERGAGLREIDVLTGGAGKDLFALGVTGGALYNDGVATKSGQGDYCVITDFTAGTDRLQLAGKKGNYFLKASEVKGVPGTGLYQDSNLNSKLDSSDELICILQSANKQTALTMANTVNVGLFV